MRAIELEENTERLDLLDYEATKSRLADIRKAEAEAEAELRSDSPRKQGRPKEPGSVRGAADRTGISTRDQGRIREHVDLAEQYPPVLKRREWRQYAG